MMTFATVPTHRIVHVPVQGGAPYASADDSGLLVENTAPIGGRVTLRHRRALVVFEGAARIAWHRGSASDWTPVGLWPGPDEAAALEQHLQRSDPVLVILSEPVATVSLLIDELSASPPQVARMAGSIEGDLVELKIPALDWLPEDIRARGLEFVEWAMTAMSTTPRALCLPFLVDRPPAASTPIRFARGRNGERVTDADCVALVESIFPSLPRARPA